MKFFEYQGHRTKVKAKGILGLSLKQDCDYFISPIIVKLCTIIGQVEVMIFIAY